MRILGVMVLMSVFFINAAHANEVADLAPIVVEASRSNDTAGQMNKNVTILTADDIADAPSESLPELLSSKLGIYGVQYGNIKNSQVDIHASGETSISNVLVLIDGRRTNQVDLSGVDWSQIDPSSIERIEIIQGSGTVLYGDNASSGVINIITKKGAKDTKPSVTLSSAIGSYQTHVDSMSISGGLHTVDYQIGYSHNDSAGYRTNSDYWANDFNSHFSYDPNSTFGIDLSQGYHLDRSQFPGALFLSDLARLGRTGTTHYGDNGTTSDSHFDVTPHLNFSLGDSQGEFSLFTSERKLLSYGLFSGFETMYETDSYEFQPKLIITTPLTDRLSNKVTGGYDYFYAKEDRRSGFVGPSEDMVFINKETNGVYLLDEATLDDKWLANVGVRGAWAQYVFDQTQQATGKSDRSPTTEGYEGGLGYKYNPNSKIYISYARSYRLPDVDEFFQNIFTGFGGGGGLNTALTYQTGNEWEWGVKDNTFKDTKLGMHFFVDQYKNEIYLDPNTFTNTNYGARTRHYGVEAEASRKFWDGKIEPFFNITFQQAVFRGGIYAGNRMTNVPDQLANAGLTIRPIENLTTSITAHETGKQFVVSDEENLEPKLKRSNTVDWNIKYDFKNMEFWLTVANIFNEKYYSYAVYSSFSNDIGYYPAPGRSVEAGVKVKF